MQLCLYLNNCLTPYLALTQFFNSPTQLLSHNLTVEKAQNFFSLQENWTWIFLYYFVLVFLDLTEWLMSKAQFSTAESLYNIQHKKRSYFEMKQRALGTFQATPKNTFLYKVSTCWYAPAN